MTFKNKQTAIFAALLAGLVLAVYWQTTGFEFINLDDLEYTVLNPLLKDGLTFAEIKEAFTSIQLRTYMPVTILSLMADVQIFGLKPSGFHFTNTLLHLLNTLLLFAFLYRATGSGWKSFFAAALWAVHPLRAESVAWVAERKDVLAGFFFLTGLLAYCEYARSRRPVFYATTLAAMVLGLLSKSIVVVFPAALLIADLWPLERFRQGETPKKLLIEKIPFISLSILFSGLSLYVHRNTFHMQGQKPLLGRLADMSTAYLHYLGETLWPFGLVMEDRNTEVHLTGLSAFGAGLLILALTFLAWKARKTVPAATAGWCWYLALLFPVSGVVLLDFFFVADHFSYLPHIGLMVALVWGTENLCSRFLKDTRSLAVVGGTLVVVLSVLCFRQVSLWKNDFIFFGYIDKMTGGQSATAKKSLGIAYLNSKKFEEAYSYFTQALLVDPSVLQGFGYKGHAAANLGRYREAAQLYRIELKRVPGDKDFSLMLANALVMAGDLPEGARQALENIKKWPEDKVAWQAINFLGGVAKAKMLAGK
ncbi:tetratricopeptide repeat protein [bacterium]|nr:MAG: tetratricopeptide repeat protein [bacterium]